MRTEFHRIAIVNRGEPAMRFIHAVREFNLERRLSLKRPPPTQQPPFRAAIVLKATFKATSMPPSPRPETPCR